MRLQVHEWGEGPPLVCLHGVTGHGRRYRRLAQERLAGRRVIAVDLRGHGHSGYEPPWSLAQHVDDLVETTEDLGIARCDWVGFSLGGRIAAELAAREPARVERLVLLDPALRIPPSYGLEAAEDERTITTFTSADQAIEARLADGSLISAPREMLEEDMAQHLTPAPGGGLMQRYCRSAAVVAWSEMTTAPPPPARVPTLFVVGSESQLANDAHVERYRAALGDGLRHERVASGHSVLWDAFEPTADAIASFLA